MIRRLRSIFVDKVWGVERLPYPFAHTSGRKIGEVWFEPPQELDQLLVKYIFASERLSVQCHPDDAQAKAMGLDSGGKNECWVIIDAKPGAKIAAGFREEISPERMREAALDGSIVDLLAWHDVRSGDVFYIPAGTVHAIGGGVSLIEVQQNSDTTFRLFDYDRPRALHLDQGVAVAHTAPYPEHHRARVDGDSGTLVDSPHFRLGFWKADGAQPFPNLGSGPSLLIPVSGRITVGEETFGPGECALWTDRGTESINGHGLMLTTLPTPLE